MFEIITNRSMKGHRTNNRSLVTLRCAPYKEALSIAVSIGLEVADLLKLEEGQRVQIISLENYPYILKVNASENNLIGYKLSPRKNSNFVRFTFLSRIVPTIRLQETFSCSYELANNKFLLIDSSKLDRNKLAASVDHLDHFRQNSTQRNIHHL